jgi:hypothetical protein
MRETQLDLEVEGKCEATWRCKLEVKQLKTVQLLPLTDTALRPVFPMPNSGADLVHCETSRSPKCGHQPIGTDIRVHAHRLLRYSLRCIVEIGNQIYTSVAVNLSARCPQAVLAL